MLEFGPITYFQCSPLKGTRGAVLRAPRPQFITQQNVKANLSHPTSNSKYQKKGQLNPVRGSVELALTHERLYLRLGYFLRFPMSSSLINRTIMLTNSAQPKSHWFKYVQYIPWGHYSTPDPTIARPLRQHRYSTGTSACHYEIAVAGNRPVGCLATLLSTGQACLA